MNTIIQIKMGVTEADRQLFQEVDEELNDSSNPCLQAVVDGNYSYRALPILASEVAGQCKKTIFLTIQKTRAGKTIYGWSIQHDEFGNVDRIPEVGEHEWKAVLEAWKRGLSEDSRELAMAVCKSFLRPFE